MKVECSNLKCKYMSDKGICKAENINLSFIGVHTINNGFKDYLKCNTFKIDEEYKQLEKKIKDILEDEKFNVILDKLKELKK